LHDQNKIILWSHHAKTGKKSKSTEIDPMSSFGLIE
jgi:hypothetical protein